MGEPAKAPVRAVAGFGSASTSQERAKIALAELERLGGFERSVIVVAAPTGVGYVNYSFAEAVEYLTRGDCAIVVPQYALVPSALALKETREGEAQQELILAGIRDRIAAMPEGSRPRVVQFGESLGAEVALDVAAAGTHRFDELGVERGLYLGTPFRTSLWVRWFSERALVDPKGLVGLVSQASEIADLPESARHVMVVHHDDPINKFDYAALVRAALVDGPAGDPPAGGPTGDGLPAGHHVHHHPDRPQERHELQARGSSSAWATTTGSSCARPCSAPTSCPPPTSRPSASRPPCATTSASGRPGGWSPPASPAPATR